MIPRVSKFNKELRRFMNMKLRGHHLICLQFFHGEGYNEQFVERLKEVVERSKNGEVVKVVYGIDEVCAVCPYLIADTCNYNEESEDKIYEIDNLALELLKLSVGDEISWKYLEDRVPEIIDIWREKVCMDCEWRSACEAHRSN